MLVKWHHQNDQIGHSSTCYIELCIKHMEVGSIVALLKENLLGDPRFLFFFLKGCIIVHEIKIKSSDFQLQIFNI